MRRTAAITGTILAVMVVAVATPGALPLQEFPEEGTSTNTIGPDTFSGTVRVNGSTPLGGLNLYACMEECIVYKSESVVVGDRGAYSGLVLRPGLPSLAGLSIEFYLSNQQGRIAAFEQPDFQGVGDKYTLDLSFDGPVPAPPASATPTPTAILPATGDTVVAAIPTWLMAVGLVVLAVGVTLLLTARRRAA